MTAFAGTRFPNPMIASPKRVVGNVIRVLGRVRFTHAYLGHELWGWAVMNAYEVFPVGSLRLWGLGAPFCK